MTTPTPQEFARSIIEDPQYRQTIVARAAAGTLSEELEILIWDLASNRVPVTPTSAKLVAFSKEETR
jgi:hypothetical protein